MSRREPSRSTLLRLHTPPAAARSMTRATLLARVHVAQARGVGMGILLHDTRGPGGGNSAGSVPTTSYRIACCSHRSWKRVGVLHLHHQAQALGARAVHIPTTGASVSICLGLGVSTWCLAACDASVRRRSRGSLSRPQVGPRRFTNELVADRSTEGMRADPFDPGCAPHAAHMTLPPCVVGSTARLALHLLCCQDCTTIALTV